MLLSGIRKTTVGDSIIVVIEELTDDIKREIRQRLVEICYGKANADSTLKAYSYSATVKEFIRRYKESSDKNNTRNKGMIGELLFHVVFGMEGDYVPISAFFNLEERSFKKGFDSGYYSSESNQLWIAEVKSGEMQKSQASSSAAMVGLLNTAKNDLKERFTSENNSLWLNAINHARNAISDIKDEKAAIMTLLGQYSDDAESDIYISSDKNVILVGVLFHHVDDEVDYKKVEAKHLRIAKENIFASVITVAIQKSTYDAVYRFLEKEANDGQ